MLGLIPPLEMCVAAPVAHWNTSYGIQASLARHWRHLFYPSSIYDAKRARIYRWTSKYAIESIDVSIYTKRQHRNIITDQGNVSSSSQNHVTVNFECAQIHSTNSLKLAKKRTCIAKYSIKIHLSQLFLHLTQPQPWFLCA